MRVEIPAWTAGEPRWLVIGQIDDKHVNTPVTARRVQRDQADSQRRPSFVFTGDGFPIASYP
jgi:hypothetical protein